MEALTDDVDVMPDARHHQAAQKMRRFGRLSWQLTMLGTTSAVPTPTANNIMTRRKSLRIVINIRWSILKSKNLFTFFKDHQYITAFCVSALKSVPGHLIA